MLVCLHWLLQVYGDSKPIAHGGSFNTKKRFFESEIQEQSSLAQKSQGKLY